MGWFGLGKYEERNRENPADAAPMRGAARFLQLLVRDLWEYVKANMLCCLCCLPAAAAGGVTLLLTSNYVLGGLAALACAVPVGAGMCGLHRVLNRSLRDLDGRVGEVFARGFRENFRAAILPGMLLVLQLLVAAYMLLFREAISAFPLPGRLWALLAIVFIALRVLLQYCFPLLVLMDLPLLQLLRNSVILFVAYPKKGLLCLLVTTLLYVAGVLLFPRSLIVILAVGLALTGLVQQCFSWESIDKHFAITQRQQAAGFVPTE